MGICFCKAESTTPEPRVGKERQWIIQAARQRTASKKETVQSGATRCQNRENTSNMRSWTGGVKRSDIAD